METVRRKKTTKHNSVYRSYQEQVMWQMHLMIFTQNYAFVDWYKTMQDEGYSQFFKKDWFVELMIINFEIAASHKYVVQKAESLWVARSEMTGHAFLVLIDDINSLLKIPVAKLLSSNNSANSSWAWQVRRLLKFQLCMVCGSIFLESKSKVLLKLCMKLSTLVFFYSVCSERPSSKHKHVFVSEWMQQGQYWSVR